MASSSTSNSPCAACKFLRRKCTPSCIFALYFPPEDPQKFVNVHKIFGASNVSKLLHDLLPHQRQDAVNSLAFEAESRVKDPIYGCVGTISILQRKIQSLQDQLEIANAKLLHYASAEFTPILLGSRYPSVEFNATQRTGNEANQLNQVSRMMPMYYSSIPPVFPNNIEHLPDIYDE